MQTKEGNKSKGKNHRSPNPLRGQKWVSWEQYFAMLTYISICENRNKTNIFAKLSRALTNMQTKSIISL